MSPRIARFESQGLPGSVLSELPVLVHSARAEKSSPHGGRGFYRHFPDEGLGSLHETRSSEEIYHRDVVLDLGFDIAFLHLIEVAVSFVDHSAATARGDHAEKRDLVWRKFAS